jgi:hypothetical protein
MLHEAIGSEPYWYARASRTVTRSALRTGPKLAAVAPASTTASHRGMEYADTAWGDRDADLPESGVEHAHQKLKHRWETIRPARMS